jgi:hypothetical protein
MSVAIGNAVATRASSILACFMLADSALWNQDFLLKAGGLLRWDLSQTSHLWLWTRRGIAMTNAIFSMIDGVAGFAKSMRRER